MPYSKEHKAETRQTILNSAHILFSAKGFDQVSIDALMQHANLTRGAFYAHFKNKQSVYSEAIIEGIRKSKMTHKKPSDITNKEWIEELLTLYLSEEHISQAIPSCPLAFMVTDIANKEEEVKDTYTKVFKQLNNAIKKLTREHSECNEQDILAVTAMMIGGVAIGRALNDPITTEKLLASCRDKTLSILTKKTY